jgi:hypothetical protein
VAESDQTFAVLLVDGLNEGSDASVFVGEAEEFDGLLSGGGEVREHDSCADVPSRRDWVDYPAIRTADTAHAD